MVKLKTYKYEGFKFVRVSERSPEAYDVYYKDELVGGVHLESGLLTCGVPTIGGIDIYSYNFNEYWKDEFRNEKERREHLKRIAWKLLSMFMLFRLFKRLLEEEDGAKK